MSNLVTKIREDLTKLLDYIKGDRFQWLNHELVAIYDNILNNEVPSMWLKCGFPCNLYISLKEWID